MTRALACVLLSGALASCGNLDRPPFDMFAQPDAPLDFNRLLADPGVYAGRPVLLTGRISVAGGQACLADRNRRIAVRLTAEQAALWADARDWPASVEGVFTQNLCPPGFVCPEFCTPQGIDAGATITDLAAAR